MGPVSEGGHLLLQVVLRLLHDLLVFLNLCGGAGGGRGKKGGHFSKYCLLLFVDVAWRLLNFKNMQSAVDCE